MKRSIFLALGSLLLIYSSSIAQSSPSDFDAEVRLGLNFRNSILSNRLELTEGPEIEVSRAVFKKLLDTSIVRQGVPFPYKLTILASNEINASSFAGGQIFAEGGIVKLLRDSPGLWAAVLGHEIAHTRSHHQFNAYVRHVSLQTQIEYYKQRAAAGDKSATWALIGLGIGGNLLNLKLSRDEELEADRLGMFMMAEAGYHPDFAITCYRRIAYKTGDQSKAAAFFADHPRWETREQRAMKAYEDALSLFRSRWTDVDRSPGGRPPAVATLTNIVTEKDEINKAAVIRATLHIRNAKDEAIIVGGTFIHDGKPVPAIIDNYKTTDGHLMAGVKGAPQSHNEIASIEIRVPTEALGIRQRKLKAYLTIFSLNAEILYTSKEFTVSFPGR